MPDCIKELDKRGLREIVIESAMKKPFLGICIGLQMLFDKSEEGDVEGFGIFEGRINRFKSSKNLKFHIWVGMKFIKIYHIPVWKNIKSGSSFYFVHSFYAQMLKKIHVTGSTNHGENLPVALARENIFAVQFHPEKSAESGLQLLKNFISWTFNFYLC